jgi:hypothetical protein
VSHAEEAYRIGEEVLPLFNGRRPAADRAATSTLIAG